MTGSIGVNAKRPMPIATASASNPPAAMAPALPARMTARQVRVDEFARDRNAGGYLGQNVPRTEPARSGDLVRIQHQFAARVLGRERNHQRVRKRPRLAGEVAQVLDGEPHLLEHLAMDRVL